MTRPFRLEEDERRYFALRSEFFVRLVQSGVPSQTVHEIMRNFGKLEDTMFFEGVRQGMIVAVFSDEADGCEPIELHGSVYHGYSTPLTRVEDDILTALADTGDVTLLNHPWLSKKPLQFGPLTLTEAIEQYGPDLVVKPVAARPRAPVVVPADPEGGVAPADLDDLAGVAASIGKAGAFDPMAALERLANGEDPEAVLGELAALGQAGVDGSSEPLQDLVELPLEDDRPLERPALLDRIRDILLRLPEPPKDWQSMILMLMRETRTDASYLDEMMSAPMGMTVVSQANLFHLHPGAMPEVKAVARP
jgi:hypothetical protein